MRRVVLLYNPHAGRASFHREAALRSVASALEAQSFIVEILPTVGAGSAGSQAAEACALGADLVFACGGDGTVHEVLQGMIHQPFASLGILPMGSANALARHLQLPMEPVSAALVQLNRHPQLVPVGHLRCAGSEGERSRYFLVLCGAGADGALVARALKKHRFGRLAYYLCAARTFLTQHFPAFQVSVCAQAGPKRTYSAVSAMAVRVGDLTGLFSPLVLGGELHHPHLRLTIVAPPAWLTMPLWFGLSWARMHRLNAHVRTVLVDRFECTHHGPARPVHVQADGEYLGHTPLTVTVVKDAVRLLLPSP